MQTKAPSLGGVSRCSRYGVGLKKSNYTSSPLPSAYPPLGRQRYSLLPRQVEASFVLIYRRQIWRRVRWRYKLHLFRDDLIRLGGKELKKFSLHTAEPPSPTGEGFCLYSLLLRKTLEKFFGYMPVCSSEERYTACDLSFSGGFAAARLLNAKSRFETIGLVYLDRKRE